MKKGLLFLILLLAQVSFAQDVNGGGLTFESLQHDFANTSLGYRKAVVEGESGADKSLVIYLHGGSSCGTDNTAQMQEPGIDSIGNYLISHQMSAVFIVPQCPDRSKGWGGLTKSVKALLDFMVNTEGIAPNRIYIFGGSMGGTGTWNMLSNYPNYFAAAMPCAANPKGMSAENVSTTPVYNVMGGADKIMDGEVRTIAENFISQLNALGDDTRYEVVAGWSHEVTCKQSYSAQRLDWVFSHTREVVDGISATSVRPASEDAWYTMQGVSIPKPSFAGVYIHAGKKVVVR